MRVIEMSMEQRWNERAGEMRDTRENPPTHGIIRHHPHIFQTLKSCWDKRIVTRDYYFERKEANQAIMKVHNIVTWMPEGLQWSNLLVSLFAVPVLAVADFPPTGHFSYHKLLFSLISNSSHFIPSTTDCWLGGPTCLLKPLTLTWKGTHINADECGPDVQTGGFRVRYPFLVNVHQTAQALDQLVPIKSRQACSDRKILAAHKIKVLRVDEGEARLGMEQCRQNEGAGQMGDPQEKPPTSSIIRHDSHMRKYESNPTRNRTRFA
ncbi:hypothetical protein PR048_019488 [Dryococelus australis]|uniref:Uncharacterized protein n=1 Tax=Dryococelus australis TaxID=614101 RepID=A0ABQ9H3Q8_9NEOP|nr:hypothetical protein PR048_019488 [Dryococelus australis]